MDERTATRFWSKVRKGEGPDDCWVWTAALSSTGYGQLMTGSLRDGTRRLAYAHRLSWEIANGPIPDGRCVLHRCDNPPCARAAHLFLGTKKANSEDMATKGRSTHGEKNTQAKLTAALVAKLREQYASGALGQITAAAQRLGVHFLTLRWALSGRTWARAGGPLCLAGQGRARGNNSGRAKLTNALVAELRARQAAGTLGPVHPVAKRIGVTDTALANALSGKTWKHVGQGTTSDAARSAK